MLDPYCSEFLAPLIMSCILSIFSLSGCPRAKKGGIKTTPIKDDKEDSELLKFVLHRKSKAFPLSYCTVKKTQFRREYCNGMIKCWIISLSNHTVI